jgi:hypothetical protein
MRGGWFGVALLGLLVSGCGGDSGGSVAPPPAAVVPPPQTTPPAPTPAPPATPAPTPPATAYPIAFDFSRDRFFNLSGVELSRRAVRNGGTPADSFTDIGATVF